MAKQTIYLVRHGEIGIGEEKRYIGQTDINLDHKGVQQALVLQRALSQVQLDKIFSSSLQRSIQTATIIGAGRELKPNIVPELNEINMGLWEGQTFATVKANYPDAFAKRGADPAGFRPPGGESFADLYQRIVPAFETIVNNSFSDVLLVAHAGVNRVLLAHILGLPQANIFRFKQDYGCLNIIKYDGKDYCLERLNELTGNL
ncbi:MAG: alpha-ribazole phosphatase [Desulfitobacteriaceae bacterium]